ncbi:hypothetical protein DIT71_08315 [Marinobacter vulgaris]|uniref:SoxXA-binding protein n=1 Tax=Marinobacter vulgaris TaxID=1928331 RepID=A0A2V3ZM41_9GAMM|nr:hypothetical protein [Marinobacter vulgaris]PXX91847.1 hypothetical protein DIT71_08315 [Marinobacter vulgaris]TSJ70645.1 hypothetical protein FPC41_07055 [Marinobacter vulgaris]
MNKPLLTIGVLLALSVPLAAQAGPKEDFNDLYAKAQSTHKDAGTFQWTVTSDRLEAAKTAAADGDYEKAEAMANEALKLAEESVAQRKKQQEAWRNVAIGN